VVAGGRKGKDDGRQNTLVLLPWGGAAKKGAVQISSGCDVAKFLLRRSAVRQPRF
jgi:hypothetical protein